MVQRPDPIATCSLLMYRKPVDLHKLHQRTLLYVYNVTSTGIHYFTQLFRLPIYSSGVCTKQLLSKSTYSYKSSPSKEKDSTIRIIIQCKCVPINILTKCRPNWLDNVFSTGSISWREGLPTYGLVFPNVIISLKHMRLSPIYQPYYSL